MQTGDPQFRHTWRGYIIAIGLGLALGWLLAFR